MKKEENRAKEMDYNNFSLGKYIYYAFNAPKKYPRKPFLYEEKEDNTMSGEEMEKMARRNTIRIGGIIK